jgi:hypothetical protein
VSSFVEYLLQQNGRPAMMLLFADLKGLGSDAASTALKSVSGYDLSEWVDRWHAHLTAAEPRAAGKPPSDDALRALTERSMPVGARDRARLVRAAELLYARGAPALATARFRGVLASDPSDPAVRFRLGRSLVTEGKPEDAAPLFVSPDGLVQPYSGWFAFQGRYRRAKGEGSAKESFDIARALDPYLEEAACDGEFRAFDESGGPIASTGPLPADSGARALCESARKIPRE